MFNQYQGIIHLEKVLLDKYNYHYHDEIDDLAKNDFIELEGEGKDALCWIIYDDDKYLFKPLDEANYNQWSELLSQEIAKILNIPCAQYRLATLGEKKGVLTKSFLKKDDTLILGSELYQNFLHKIQYQEIQQNFQIPESILSKKGEEKKKLLFNYLNNLSSTVDILKNSNTLSSDERQKITIDLVKLLVFDLITLQGDRHANNWGLVKKEKGYYLSPLYDNGLSFGLGYPFMERRIEIFRSENMNAKMLHDNKRVNQLLYQTTPNFTLSIKNIINPEQRKKDNPPQVLKDLLASTSLEMKKWIIDSIFLLQELGIDEIISKTEQLANTKMDANLYYYISEIFESNLQNLVQVIEEYGKEPRKNAVSKTL